MMLVPERAEDRCEESPAEIIMNMKTGEVLRLTFCRNVATGRVQGVELYIWICPKTQFFKGLYIISGQQIHPMSETPLNSRQVLNHINETSFLPGHDPLELISGMNIDDLRRLHQLSQAAA